MIRSMTGYGRASGRTSLGEVKVEVRSLNHRFLEINIRAPKELSALEMEIRGLIRSKIQRGKVDLTLRVERAVEGPPLMRLEVNWGLIETYLGALEAIKERYGLEGRPNLEHILWAKELISFREVEVEEGVWEELRPVVLEALVALVESRQREGERIQEDLEVRLERLKQYVQQIEERAPRVVEEYRRRLSERLKQLLPGELDQGRFEQEVAYFAEKSDITEEVVRLHSHLEEFRRRLREEGPVGRALDFLLQEMNRETNTLGSKANDLEIVQRVLAIKEEIEKLREQVQNVE